MFYAQAKMLELPSITRIELGVDEAGRGPFAFDVCSAAVLMPHDYDPDDKLIKMINDSKKVTEKRRDVLAEYIKQKAVAYGIGVATVEEIDSHNILQATYMAMHRAINKAREMLSSKGMSLEHIMVDGNRFKPYDNIPHTCCIGGDAKHLNIAAASILAKTYRDKEISNIVSARPDLDEKYGFSKNKGYGTAKHMAGLKAHGPCEFHRKSYAPVRDCMK